MLMEVLWSRYISIVEHHSVDLERSRPYAFAGGRCDIVAKPRNSRSKGEPHESDHVYEDYAAGVVAGILEGNR